MPYYCTVPRCTSMAGKAKNVSFHQFPRDEELAKLWNKILKRGKPYTKYSKVCSLHFKPEDYTITSVGKNKGQWRTLRKDAIPSQNLPSESPTPYHRKQWSTWGPHTPQNTVIDPAIQQQMAQAIYMQTMLAMQAAGAADIPPLLQNNDTSSIQDQTLPHSSHELKSDLSKSTSYKCTECSKCFKDPDVFLLHKRSHIKNEQKQEKENFNTNTLRSNPILANLLKNQNSDNIFDNNITMENLLMTALAANLDYIRNISLIKNDRNDCVDEISDELTNNTDGRTENCDGFTPIRISRQNSGEFTPNRSENCQKTDERTQCNDGFTPIRISRQNNGEFTANRSEDRPSDGFPNKTDGCIQNSDGFTPIKISRPNSVEFNTNTNEDSQESDRFTNIIDGLTQKPSDIMKVETDEITTAKESNVEGSHVSSELNPPLKTKCHKILDKINRKETPNSSFKMENQYRIDLKYADIKVNSGGIRSADTISSADTFTSANTLPSTEIFPSADTFPSAAVSNSFKTNSEIKSVANCDSELNESYESSNLIIDENL